MAEKAARRSKKTAVAPVATRKQRTPREKVQDELDVERRKAAALRTRLDRLKSEIGPVETDLAQTERRVAYLEGHPDLEGSPAPTAGVDTSVQESAE